MGDVSLSIPEEFNVAEYFIDRNLLDGRGEKIAVYYRDEELTYIQVGELVNRAANVFKSVGVQESDRVLLLLLDSPAFVAAFWGAIKLGAVAVPVNTLLAANDYEFLLRDSGARCLVIDRALVEKVAPFISDRAAWRDLKAVYIADQPAGRQSAAGLPDQQAAFRNFSDQLARQPAKAAACRTHRDDPAFWLYTSGSTGVPKAAIHLQHDMVWCLECFAKRVLEISSADRTFSTSKLFFAYGLGNGLYFPFGAGGSTVLLDERPTPEKTLAILRRHRPTLFFAVPAVYAALLQAPEAFPDDFRSVRSAVSAGEALPAPLWERFRDRFGISILDGIGSTEMLHMFISNWPRDVVPGSSGKLVPGYEAKIVDGQGKELPHGEMGELYVRGESAAAGYWNRPELTSDTFRSAWTVTGDKYVLDERGYFWYRGRTDDMLKVSGMWVSPLEIESALLAHPAVAECAVVGAKDDDGLTKPKAFVVPKAHTGSPAELPFELEIFLHNRLPGYKVPRWIELAQSLPRTATGKVQRFKLRKRAETGG